jgi:type I restriction enzyme R subunit
VQCGESLAIFDLLLNPDISKQEIVRIKKVAKGIYNILQTEVSRFQVSLPIT